MANILVKSYGCSANISEGEMIKGILSASHTIKDEQPDTIILNICTVKGDKQALREIKLAHEQHPNKKIIIAGCITPSIVEPIKKIIPDVSLVNTHNIDKITQVIDNPPQTFLDRARKLKVNLPRIRKNPVVGIVNIASGCTSACTFCSTKLVKGGLQSYPARAILDECQQHIAEGCREIWLTSQDNGAWGVEWKQNLSHLLTILTQELRGPYLIRNGMGNPKHIIRFIDDLIAAYQHPKMLKFLHLPVQSGSDKILDAMLRQHHAHEFIEIVRRFRETIPEMTISTDIIVGFPGETEEDFEKTLAVIREIQPDVVNISRFAARPGTAAAIMPQVQGNVIKERSRQLTELCRRISLERNQKWIGWEGDVLIDEDGKNNDWIGKNHAYKQIVLSGSLKLGQIVRARVTDATKWDLRGEVVEMPEKEPMLLSISQNQ